MKTHQTDKLKCDLEKPSGKVYTGAKNVSLVRAPKLPILKQVNFKYHCRNIR